MKTIARITAFVLIALGLLIMIGGAALGVTGALHAITNTPAAVRPLRAGGTIGLIAIGFIFVEGLTVIGIGEGLYLLADMVNKIQPG